MINIISEWASTQPDKLAAIYNGSPVTYAQFAHAIFLMTQQLSKAGLPQGQTAIVVIDNRLDDWVVCLALRGIGLDTVCVNTTALANRLHIDNVCCIVSISEENIPATELDASSWPLARHVVVAKPQYINGEFFNKAHGENPAAEGGHILYTSGTTGEYKKLFCDAVQQRATSAVGALSYTNESVFHCSDFGLWTAAGFRFPPRLWCAGGCIVFEQRDEWWQYFLEAGMSHAILVPFSVNLLLQWCLSQPAPPTKKSFVLSVTGGFLSPKNAGLLLTHVTDELVNIYATTELSGVTLSAKINTPEDLLWLYPAVGRTIEIVDENDQPCPTGQQGHMRILLQEHDFKEYLGDPETSANFFKDGYFYPGDMAVANDDGLVQPLGRKLDVLNVAGTKLASAPLELELQNMMAVDAVCLFTGIDHAGSDELVVAVRTDTMPSDSDVKRALDHLHKFQNVRFAFTREFPLTGSGTQKTDRVELRRLLFPPA